MEKLFATGDLPSSLDRHADNAYGAFSAELDAYDGYPEIQQDLIDKYESGGYGQPRVAQGMVSAAQTLEAMAILPPVEPVAVVMEVSVA